MTESEFFELLACQYSGSNIRVNSRERTDLEFKASGERNSILKSIKTIAAFANRQGGNIVFGVSDRPRSVCGIEEFLDESELQDILTRHLYPVPDVQLFEHFIGDYRLIRLRVLAARKAPVMAIKDLQTSERRNSNVLNQGVIYYRRSGQTKPASGEELASILEKRDNFVRNSILDLLSRAGEIGFESVAIADFRQYGSRDENVTLYVPESAAHELNIIDRAKLVSENGAPAYQIRGAVRLTASTDRDPRKPLLPEAAARALRAEIRKIFWPEFPWVASHLRKAASHLGFWDNANGDGSHTGINEVTGGPVYFEAGRAAIQRFATRNSDEFIEAIGSLATKAEWGRRKRQDPFTDA